LATVFEPLARPEEWIEEAPLEQQEDDALERNWEDEAIDDATPAAFFLEGSSDSIDDCLDRIEVAEEGG
jgi:hypothetical protein